MRKSILFRLFGLGAIPKELLPALRTEKLLVADEGMRGRLTFRDAKGPWRRFIRRTGSFSGSLVITERRIVGYTFGRRQISIAVDDPRVCELRVSAPEEEVLLISFESSAFRNGWEGELEFRFETDKARRFHDVLSSICADAREAGR